MASGSEPVRYGAVDFAVPATGYADFDDGPLGTAMEGARFTYDVVMTTFDSTATGFAGRVSIDRGIPPRRI